MLLLALPFERGRLPGDVLLGMLYAGSAGLAVLGTAGSGAGLVEVRAILHGDLILASSQDVAWVAATTLPVLAGVLMFLRPLQYSFLDRDAAHVLGVRPAFWDAAFFLMLGMVVAAVSKITGALLVFCLLLAPAATGLLLARRLGWVLGVAALAGVGSTLLGLGLSFSADLPTNATIVACASGVFVLAAMLRRLRPRQGLRYSMGP